MMMPASFNFTHSKSELQGKDKEQGVFLRQAGLEDGNTAKTKKGSTNSFLKMKVSSGASLTLPLSGSLHFLGEENISFVGPLPPSLNKFNF
jgi:hypothetical protein